MSPTSSRSGAYPGAAGCGTVTVDGSYNVSLTIASDNDMVDNYSCGATL